MIKFEVGHKYYTRSVCNHDCAWTFTVIKRTAQTVTLAGGRHGVKTCRISKQTSNYRGAESVFPLGQYSMAPILSADHINA